MPLLRHGCRVCNSELVDLYGPTDPGPKCCGEAMRLLMPRRVVGRCTPDSNGVHAGSGFARSQPRPEPAKPGDTITVGGQELTVGDPNDCPSELPQSRTVSKPVDPTDESIIPPAPHTGVFAKDYEDCTAEQRDSRWRDGAQALASWTAKQLEAKGEAPRTARDTATEAAQTTIAKARAESTRADGLT